jgi:hypothetical protein
MVAVLSFITMGAGVCAPAEKVPPTNIAAAASALYAAFVVLRYMQISLPLIDPAAAHARKPLNK